jgi:RNA polymerase subunit RPABC4/transcription elongation factor Spt4
MNPCQNCGKLNEPNTIFCRFCGTKFNFRPPVPPNPFDHAPPPRPYSWKTDEFQAQKAAPKATMPIDRLQSATSPFLPASEQYQPGPLAYQQPQYLDRGFQCPRCMSQHLPRIERRVSTAGWITFAVLLVFFFPLFWIGLLIKEDVKVCQTCRTKIG